jgi:hypothetical protein
VMLPDEHKCLDVMFNPTRVRNFIYHFWVYQRSVILDIMPNLTKERMNFVITSGFTRDLEF